MLNKLSLRTFLSELKRRRVFRVAAVYAAVAFVILQAADLMFARVGLPDWTVTLVVWLIVLGFPLALVLAWAFELTPEGVKRTEPPPAAAPAAARYQRTLFAAGVVIAALLGAGLAAWYLRAPTSGNDAAVKFAAAAAADAPLERSIAVLPFSNLSESKENEYFSDGITEAILTNLAKVSDLKVISRTSVMQYKETRKPLRQIGQELGVAHVLVGSVQRAGDRVRITAQLINARTDEHLWAQSYDRELKDIFQVQSEIAEQIASALRTEISGADRTRLATAPTEDLEAYQLYLKGRFLWNTQRESDRPRALAHYQQALRRDSSFALAYAGLADLYADMAGEGNPEQNWARSKAAARRALELDSTLASPHSALGYIHHWYDWDFPAAERQIRRALELDPGYSVARNDYGTFLVTMGRVDQGIAHVRRAVELDPLTWWMHGGLGEVLLVARRYDEAIQAGKAAVELDPEARYGHWILWQAYLEKGMTAQALAEYRAMATSDPNRPRALAMLAYIHARTGKAAEARKLLVQIEASERARRESPNIPMARAYAALGDADAAFRWLERARRERDGDIVWLKVDPALDPLRSDPRFQELLQQVGFP